MRIELDGIRVTKDGVHVDGGSKLPWSTVYRILETLPQLARNRLGHFPFSGPPSMCREAVDELKDIISALHKEGS